MKMKSTILSMLMLATMVGCQKNTPENKDLINSNEEVIININIKTTANTITRNATTLAGVAGESEINNVTVLAFNKDNVLEKVMTNTSEATDVTKVTFEITEGDKTIIAIVNTEGINMSMTAGTTTLSDLKALTLTMADNDASEIATSGLFKMIGETKVKVTTALAGDTDGINVGVDVSRLAAKVSVAIDAAALNTKNEGVVADNRLAFTLTTISTTTTGTEVAPAFALNQIYKNINVYESATTNTVSSPNDLLAKTLYKTALTTTPEVGTSYDESIYCSKNFPEVSQTTDGVITTKTKATIVSVKLQLIPTKFIVSMMKDQIVADAKQTYTYTYSDPKSLTGSETYYGFMYEGTVYAPFESNRTAVNAYKVVTGTSDLTIPDGAGLKYDNCINYYDIRIGNPTATNHNDASYYKVLSNSYYKLTVDAVGNFGVGVSTILTDVPDAPRDLFVTIEVQDWDLYDLGLDL